jgi:hypothetical protein
MMKITKDQLMQIILEELSPQRIQEASTFQMSKYDEESNNIMMMTGVVMAGIQAQAGLSLGEEDEYEYGQDVRSIFENNMPVTNALVDIFMEIRAGGTGVDEPESMSHEDVEEEDA